MPSTHLTQWIRPHLDQYKEPAFARIPSLLQQYPRVCICIPTGTGKSILCELAAGTLTDKNILYVTSSNHGKEQFSSVFCGTTVSTRIDYEIYHNLRCRTYKGLGLIILDEFHRVGAPTYMRSVLALFLANPDALVFGVTATPIRYSDHQRNMLYELFHGNCALQMSLFEALQEKYLLTPEYITCIYDISGLEASVRETLHDYQQMVPVELLDKARLYMENCVNIGSVLENNIKYKTGSYFVFCKNITHLKDMMERAKSDWFHSIPQEKVMFYYDYSGAKKHTNDYDAFVKDSDRKKQALKLFFVVNKTNESMHSINFDGVIFLRPTDSLTIYLQQLGRIMHIHRKNVPQVFDLVGNAHHLAVPEKMIRGSLPHEYGLPGDITFHGGFSLIPKVKELAQTLEIIKALTGRRISWEIKYNLACLYMMEFGGNINKIPKNYKCYGVFNLYSWLIEERHYYKAKDYTHLSKERIKLLEDLGIDWEYDPEFEYYYALCEQYYNVYHNLYITRKHNPFEEEIFRFFRILRARYSGKAKPALSSSQIERMNRLGFIWNPRQDRTKWWDNFQTLKTYYETHPGQRLPSTGEWLPLYNWKTYQIRIYRHKVPGCLQPDEIGALRSIGILSMNENKNNGSKAKPSHRQKRTRVRLSRQQVHALFQRYYDECGRHNIDVKYNYVTPEGYPLGHMLHNIRTAYKRNTLKDEDITFYEDLGIQWTKLPR